MAIGTYVLVHGAWHGGWCWAKVARLLRDAAQDVYTPTLTGLGERAHLARPEVDLETHIQDVVAVLEREELRQVTLVGHSYGGMVITGVAARAAVRISHLVYSTPSSRRRASHCSTTSGRSPPSCARPPRLRETAGRSRHCRPNASASSASATPSGLPST
jgi:pimeloyl-ACP methyl ester carboxylesterase